MPFISNPQSSDLECIALIDRDMVVRKDGAPLNFQDMRNLLSLEPKGDFFSEPDFSYTALSLSSSNIPEEYAALPLRQFFAEQGEESSFRPFRARAISTWRSTHRYCAYCGAKLLESSTLSARECPECKKIYFPRICPCVIVAVHKEGKVLLARHTYRNQDIFACLAGFMEAGESAEQAVTREVFEETGIRIKNITYRGSQSWPFPDQLMLGFTADYDSGEIKLQEKEIAEVQWFDPENCPASPKPGSIAYRLIHGLY